MNTFDRKFGAEFIGTVPSTPGVYLFKDAHQQVLYVGKAKSLRRRLASYRAASRRKVHRKMRMLVAKASSLEVRAVESEEHALVLENALIRELRPTFNVDGAYHFLYPAIGIRRTPARTLLCFTTSIEPWAAHELQWCGVFRSRPRAKLFFDTLVSLLSIVGHLERTSALGPRPRLRGSRLVGVRQLNATLVDSLASLFAGESSAGLTALLSALLERPRARQDAEEVGSALRELKAFYDSDLKPLRDALVQSGRGGTFVSQEERDVLFIKFRPDV